jgi:hypothetical protein
VETNLINRSIGLDERRVHPVCVRSSSFFFDIACSYVMDGGLWDGTWDEDWLKEYDAGTGVVCG